MRSGKWATFSCQRCSFDYPWKDAKTELSGSKVCRDCYDGRYQLTNHPQNFVAPELGPDGVLEWVRGEPNPDLPVELSAVDLFKRANAFDYVFVPTSSSSGPG
jgi:hypothetical protein